MRGIMMVEVLLVGYTKERGAILKITPLFNCGFPTLFLFVTLVEFINTTCGVNQFHLTSVEWVRCI